MKKVGSVLVLLAWIAQNVFMTTFISHQKGLSDAERFRTSEQTTMLLHQMQFVAESKRDLPSLDVLYNSGRNYLRTLRSIISTNEQVYGPLENQLTTAKIDAMLAEVEQNYKDTMAVLSADSLIQGVTSLNVIFDYDPKKLSSQFDELFNTVYFAFVAYESYGVKIEPIAEKHFRGANRWLEFLFYGFIGLYILGSLLIIIHELRSRSLDAGREDEILRVVRRLESKVARKATKAS